MDGALESSVGAQLRLCEAGGWIVVVPLPARGRRAGAATLLALRSLLSGTPQHFGHPQIPFWAHTNAFWGTHKCPKMYLLSFRTDVHPVDFN